VYQYKDHLGNVRLSYADYNGDGSINPTTEILEENNYYPFGLKHQGYNQIANAYRNEAAEKYKYNGKEFQDELGLDWYDYHARNYDPAIGRFTSVDPLAEQFPSWNPYTYTFNNPIRFTDPTGMAPDDIIVGQKYQAQFNKALSSVFGAEASNFSYDSNGKLSFSGDTKKFNSDQKAIFKGLDNLMSSKDVTNIVYEQNYTIVDNNGNSINIDASKSGGESTILKAENPTLSENYVIVDPNGPTSVNVMEVTSNYYSSKGTMPSPGDPPNFKSAIVQTNPENSTIHGIGHVVNAGKSQDKVLNYDNKARNQVGLPKRNPDETHNKTVTKGSGSVWEKN